MRLKGSRPGSSRRSRSRSRRTASWRTWLRRATPRRYTRPEGRLGIRFFLQDELPRDVISRDFVGEQHGGVGACVIFVDAAPGEGPRLHRHPYVEILIVVEGTATFDDGQSKREVQAGEMAVVDAD